MEPLVITKEDFEKRKIWDVEISDPWWSKIKSGEKCLEGKKGSPKWKPLKIGDIVRAINSETRESFMRVIWKINEYSDLNIYLQTEGIERALPGVSEMARNLGKKPFEHARDIYLGYFDPDKIKAEEEAKKYGMRAIYLNNLYVM